MSKLIFTPKQIQILKTNLYIKNAPEKRITYSDEFKRPFFQNHGIQKTARQIFFEVGFDLEILHESRIKAFTKKWQKKYRDNSVLTLKDTQQGHSDRAGKTELTPEQQIKKLKSKISLLEQKKELVKKIRMERKEARKKGKN